MRNALGLAVGLGLLLSTAQDLRADEGPRAVLTRALRAHGGADRLGKLTAMKRTSRGALAVFGKELPFKATEFIEFPSRRRLEIELQALDQPIPIVSILNGDKGWRLNGGMAVDLLPEEVNDLREEMYVIRLTTLAPFTGNEFDLTAVPDVKVHARDAAGFKVSHKAHGEVKMYFDKGTGLLVKIERQIREGAGTVPKEYVFSEEKSFDGVMLATKQAVTVGGKKTEEVSILGNEFPSKVEENLFGKP